MAIQTPNLSFDPPLNWKMHLRTATPLEAKFVELTFRVLVSIPPPPPPQQAELEEEKMATNLAATAPGVNGQVEQEDGTLAVDGSAEGKAEKEEKAGTKTEDNSSFEIQVWTNATPKGEWLAIPFKQLPKENEIPNGPYVFNVSSTSTTSAPIDAPTQIELEAPLRLANDSERSFTYSYTYRLVYPSGKIKWLGSFGSDGTFEIIPQGLDYFHEGYGWIETSSTVNGGGNGNGSGGSGKEGPTGKVFTVGQSVAAGNFNVRDVSWSGWSISSKKIERFDHTLPAEISGHAMIFLTPSYYTSSHSHSTNATKSKPFLTTPPLIFIITSEGSHLTFDKLTGAIKFYSSDGGSLERYLHLHDGSALNSDADANANGNGNGEGERAEGTLRHVLQPFRNVREISCFWASDAILLLALLSPASSTSAGADDDEITTGDEYARAHDSNDDDETKYMDVDLCIPTTVSLHILPLRHPEHSRATQNLALRPQTLHSLIHPIHQQSSQNKSDTSITTTTPCTPTTHKKANTPIAISSSTSPANPDLTTTSMTDPSNPAFSCLYSPDTTAFVFIYCPPSNTNTQKLSRNDNTIISNSNSNPTSNSTSNPAFTYTSALATQTHPHSHFQPEPSFDSSTSDNLPSSPNSQNGPLIYLSHAPSGGQFLVCPVYDMISDEDAAIASSWQLVLPIPGVSSPLITTSTSFYRDSDPSGSVPRTAHINLDESEGLEDTGRNVDAQTQNPVNTSTNALPTPPDSPTIEAEELFQPLLASLSRSEPTIPEAHSSPRASGQRPAATNTPSATAAQRLGKDEGSPTASVARSSFSSLRQLQRTPLAWFHALLSIFRWAFFGRFVQYVLRSVQQLRFASGARGSRAIEAIPGRAFVLGVIDRWQRVVNESRAILRERGDVSVRGSGMRIGKSSDDPGHTNSDGEHEQHRTEGPEEELPTSSIVITVSAPSEAGSPGNLEPTVSHRIDEGPRTLLCTLPNAEEGDVAVFLVRSHGAHAVVPGPEHLHVQVDGEEVEPIVVRRAKEETTEGWTTVFLVPIRGSSDNIGSSLAIRLVGA